MATRVIPILGAATMPDATGNVWQEPAAVNLQTNDRYPNLVWAFADTSTRLKLGFAFRVPVDYVGTPKLIVEWATTVTSGKVVIEADYTAAAIAESSDPSADQETVTVNASGVTVPGTARLIAESEMALTGANLAPGDRVMGAIVRDGADTTNDTAAGVWYVLDAYFSYADA